MADQPARIARAASPTEARKTDGAAQGDRAAATRCRLVAFLRWDWVNQSRQNMIGATVLSTAALAGVAALAPSRPLEPAWTTLLLLADPAAVGLGFVGAAIFLERSSRVIAALGAAPSPPTVYIASKTLLFTAIGVVSGLIVAAAATGLWVETGAFGVAAITLGLALGNAAAALLGVGLAAGAPSMNAFLLRAAVVTLPLAAPPIALFAGGAAALGAPLLWAIPSTPTTTLLAAGAGAEIRWTGLAAATVGGLLWTGLAWRFAAAGLRRLLARGGA